MAGYWCPSGSYYSDTVFTHTIDPKPFQAAMKALLPGHRFGVLVWEGDQTPGIATMKWLDKKAANWAARLGFQIETGRTIIHVSENAFEAMFWVRRVA